MYMYIHVDLHYFCLMFVEGKDISCDALEEEECTLDKDVPEHGRYQDTSEIPEYLNMERNFKKLKQQHGHGIYHALPQKLQ